MRRREEQQATRNSIYFRNKYQCQPILMHTREMHYRAEKDITRSACNVYAQKINWIQKHDSTSREMLFSCSFVRMNFVKVKMKTFSLTSKGKTSSIAEYARISVYFRLQTILVSEDSVFIFPFFPSQSAYIWLWVFSNFRQSLESF